VPQLHKQVRNY